MREYDFLESEMPTNFHDILQELYQAQRALSADDQECSQVSVHMSEAAALDFHKAALFYFYAKCGSDFAPELGIQLAGLAAKVKNGKRIRTYMFDFPAGLFVHVIF